MKVGITGGIGSGKSLVCHLIKEMGYPVYDCDTMARQLMTRDSQLARELTLAIGPQAYLNDTIPLVINKPYIASFVFNPDKSHLVNDVVHRRLARHFEEWAAQQEAGRPVFMESAILFESGFDRLVDQVVFVEASPSTRVERVMRRDQSSRQEVERRIASQMDDNSKKRQAGHIIHNDIDTDEASLIGQINRIIHHILTNT